MLGTGNRQDGGDRSAVMAQSQGADLESTNAELHSIASTIEELQRRLEATNNRLSRVAEIETTQIEIGRLFVEAQRFSEESLSKLELQIHEVLTAAESKAKQILIEASEEALEIRREAQEATVASRRTARELQSAISGFTTVNVELVKELDALSSLLTPASGRGMAELNSSSSSPATTNDPT
jgi:cell division septum initiation protein DivIVA